MKKLFILLIFAALLFPGCVSQKRTKKVQRTNTDAQIDLSGRWNDVDSQQTADAMIKQMLGGGWLKKAMSKKEGDALPTVTVGGVKNKSNEHISTETFVKDLQRAVINSGEISFVTGRNSNRDMMRDEVKEQVANASDSTAKGPGEEIGADYMLLGQINTITDRSGGTTVRYYQVELELHEIGTNKIVWMGQKKIKKVVQQKRSTW